VAGYDLNKLYVGALGTLGVIVEITLKLRPRPEADRGVWAAFPDVGGAARAALALMASELIAHSLEVLDAEAIAECPALHRWTRERPGAGLLVAFDGLAETVDWQCRDASARLGAAGAGAVAGLDDSATAECLAAVRDLRGGVEPTLAVATAAVPPAALAAYLTEAQAVAGIEGLALRTVAHAGHGLATLVLVTRTGTPRNGTAAARVLGGLREAARARGGHLRLDRAPLGVKEAMSVWDAPGASVPLMQAIKRELDPRGLMNPGRFVGGI
jgi:FAD/FMN-containing dehydrogenase